MPSLQDQLLKAGIANKKNAKRAAAEKRRENAAHNAANQGKKKKQQQPKVSDTQLAIEKQAAEKAAKDRELNRQKQLAAEQKAQTAQIKQLIETNTVAREKGDAAYRFTDNGETQSIYVTTAQQKQLGSGVLAIVTLNEQYHLVPSAVANKVNERDTSYVVLVHEKNLAVDENDPYADFQIPDDFTW